MTGSFSSSIVKAVGDLRSIINAHPSKAYTVNRSSLSQLSNIAESSLLNLSHS